MLGLAAVLIPIMLLLSFSYQSRVRTEALRAHRVYWNDLVTKSAEGTAEEAYLWFLNNQDDPANKIAAFLKGKPGGAKTITLNGSQVSFIDRVKATYGNNDVITKCTMKLVEEKPFFQIPPFPPSSFDAASKGLIYPDPDMFGLLKVEVEANYHGFRRRYVVIREVKAVNILPGIFGQFTLFVKEKKDEMDYDWNHLKTNSTGGPPPVLDNFGFIKKDSNELSNPLVLIHSRDDLARTCYNSALGTNDVSPPADPAWSTIDLTKRGWVFMGRNSTQGPLQDYVFQPLNGEIKTACNPAGAGVPTSIPTDKWLFFGGNFLLSNHTKLWYFLRLNDSNRPAFANLTSGKFELTVPNPDLQDSTRYLIGWVAWQTRLGYMSLTRNVLQGLPSPCPGLPTFFDLLKNYYDDPKHLVGNEGEAGRKELPHGSLILPMGDLFPLDSSQVSDRRSPTVVLGVWLRFLQTGNIVQVDDDMKSALSQSPAGDWLAKLNDPANTVKPATFWLPYFPIHADRSNPAAPVITFGPEPDTLGWANKNVWAKADDSGAPSGADFAKVSYNVIDHIMRTFGDERNPYEIVMTKLITVPGMLMYDLLIGNNMRGPVPSLFVPSSPNKLDNFETTDLGKVLKPVSPSGVPITGTGLGKSFFYQSPNSSTQAGRGLSGECIAIKDLVDRPLAVGNLGALWPFPDGTNASYDLGHKATHNASTPADFLRYFTQADGANLLLDLKNGIVTVRGNLTLDAGSGKIIYKNGGMLIASDGELLIKSPIQRDAGSPEETLVLATAKKDRDIKLCAGTHQAFFLSSGTVKRESPGPIKIEGGLAVRYLEYKKSSSSLFSGFPGNADARQTIVWDKTFNVLDPVTYAKGIKLNLGGSMAYWASEKMD